MIAVAAQSRSTEPDQAWDRLGRPEITNVTMHARKGMTDLRDKYNLSDPFRIGDEHKAYYDRIHDNIHTYDMIDGRQDIPEDQLSSLANILANDYLVIDPFHPNCAHSSYFEIERAAILGQAPTGCGGRDPNDRFMDVLYTLYVKGLSPEPNARISERVSAVRKSPSRLSFLISMSPRRDWQRISRPWGEDVLPP